MRDSAPVSGGGRLDGDGSRRIAGNSAMAQLLRGMDWSQSPLGAVSGWSDALVMAVNLVMSSPLPMQLLWGPELVCLYNDALAPVLSDKHPASVGRPGREVWSEAWDVVGPQLLGVLERGEVLSVNDVHLPLLKQGELVDYYWSYTYSPVFGKDGRIEGVLNVSTDMTEKVLAERQRAAAVKALHLERERLLSVLHQAPAFFAVLEGAEHRFTMANERYLRLVGGRQILGRTLAEALPEAVEQGYLAMLDDVFSTGKPVALNEAPFRLEAGDGVEFFLDFTYQPLRNSANEVDAILVMGVDVTERRKSHQALLQTEKLAAVGRLAASIAHEINNPLESITNLVYLAKDAANKDELLEYLRMADVELGRVSAITNQTLRFHRQSTSPRRVTSTDVFDTALSIYQGRLVDSGVTVERDRDADVPLECFDGELRQVLSNLVGNAIDSMRPSGGRLILRSRPARSASTGEDGVLFTVADTGCGMSRETLTRAFDAFYTTKGESGTGLGLWVSSDIVARHQGRLRVRSCQTEGRSGTVFTLFLPAVAAPRRLPGML